MLAVKIYRRDLGGMASTVGALMLPLAAALAALGGGMGPTVMAISLLSAAASLLGILSAVEHVWEDREGWIAPLIASLGRAKYAVLRTVVSVAVATTAATPALTLYALARPEAAFPVAAAVFLSAATGASLGVLVGVLTPTRGHGYAWGVSAWTALALIYEVVLTFVSLYFPVTEAAIAAALLANPLASARLSGAAQADPHLLTLGAVGDYLYKALGPYSHLLFPTAAILWVFAFAAANIVATARRDL